MYILTLQSVHHYIHAQLDIHVQYEFRNTEIEVVNNCSIGLHVPPVQEPQTMSHKQGTILGRDRQLPCEVENHPVSRHSTDIETHHIEI